MLDVIFTLEHYLHSGVLSCKEHLLLLYIIAVKIEVKLKLFSIIYTAVGNFPTH